MDAEWLRPGCLRGLWQNGCEALFKMPAACGGLGAARDADDEAEAENFPETEGVHR